MNNKQVQFLPFHAINEFMRSDYRNKVVRAVLSGYAGLPSQQQAALDKATRKSVLIPGFRNSAKAPVGLRIKLTADVFEKSPQMVAAVLTAWSELHAGLRQDVYDFLKEKGWEILPQEADRSLLPGFLIVWPKGDDLEPLAKAFVEQHAEQGYIEDDAALMIVWLCGRLPYQTEGEDEDVTEDEAEDEAEDEEE